MVTERCLKFPAVGRRDNRQQPSGASRNIDHYPLPLAPFRRGTTSPSWCPRAPSWAPCGIRQEQGTEAGGCLKSPGFHNFRFFGGEAPTVAVSLETTSQSQVLKGKSTDLRSCLAASPFARNPQPAFGLDLNQRLSFRAMDWLPFSFRGGKLPSVPLWKPSLNRGQVHGSGRPACFGVSG